MKESQSSDKLFGNLALALLIAGLLVPFVIGAFVSEGLAMGFGAVACLLALVLGIIGWKQKTGKVTVVAIAVLTVFAAGTYSLVCSRRSTAMEEREAMLEQAAPETAEPNIGQVSSESALLASPDEPSM